MKTVSVSDAKNSLSALLKEVRGGQCVVITDRGVPVAQITPLAETTGLPPQAIELAQQGRLVLPEREARGDWMRLPIAQTTRPGISIVAALIEERASGY